MSEGKKRFPWWQIVGAVLLAILGTALGFIETVGRRGTLIGRWELLREREEIAESDLLRIVGPPLRITPYPIPGADTAEAYVWEDGPASLAAMVYPSPVHPEVRTATVMLKYVDQYKDSPDPPFTWHVRRWAERAYTAIHGPRR